MLVKVFFSDLCSLQRMPLTFFPRASSFLYIERLIVLFIKNKMRVIWFIITQAFRLKSYICVCNQIGSMNENVLTKLKILAESAKYDVSCASSGTVRSNKPGMLGNTVGGWGICHSFAEDGRCISLLKVMLTNYCIYDCAYCINRRSNDLPRATLSVSELVELTIEFYRRNYIEGLFLSSGILISPNYTMDLIYQTLYRLRTVHHFNGYIHVKAIPGADPALIEKAGFLADRMSINLELPTANADFDTPTFRAARFNTYEMENRSKSHFQTLPEAVDDGQWHTYRFDWHTGDANEQARVDFYVDGQLLYTSYEHIPTHASR